MSPAESIPYTDRMEVHSGVDGANHGEQLCRGGVVVSYGLRTLRALREGQLPLLRVEPRITSSLIRDGVFFCYWRTVWDLSKK